MIARTMTPAAHYAEAEKLIALAKGLAGPEWAESRESFREEAKIHAALAAVDATVWPDVAQYHDTDVQTVKPSRRRDGKPFDHVEPAPEPPGAVWGNVLPEPGVVVPCLPTCGYGRDGSGRTVGPWTHSTDCQNRILR
jgi:hypothetical protein